MIGSCDYPGTLKTDDVFGMGNAEHRQTVEDCKKTLQFDEPINIQFTSVSIQHKYQLYSRKLEIVILSSLTSLASICS